VHSRDESFEKEKVIQDVENKYQKGLSSFLYQINIGVPVH